MAFGEMTDQNAFKFLLKYFFLKNIECNKIIQDVKKGNVGGGVRVISSIFRQFQAFPKYFQVWSGRGWQFIIIIIIIIKNRVP